MIKQPAARGAAFLIPDVVMRRVEDRDRFSRRVAEYDASSDDELFHSTQVCLRNLERVDDVDVRDPDVDLRLFLVPELWERIRRGTRTGLRRITSSLAEYEHDPDRPCIFRRFHERRGTVAEFDARRSAVGVAAEAARQRLSQLSALAVADVVDMVRFAMIGSRACVRWTPCAFVYEPGFTYCVVPAIARRALLRGIAPSAPVGADTARIA